MGKKNLNQSLYSDKPKVMRKIILNLFFYLLSINLYAGIHSSAVNISPAFPLINDTITLTVDLNNTLEDDMLFITENLYLYPLNLKLNPELGQDRLIASAEAYKMFQVSNNIWEIKFVPNRIFQNVTGTTALKFQLKTKNYNAKSEIGKITSSYFTAVFYNDMDTTLPLVCGGKIQVNYTDSFYGELRFISYTNGTLQYMTYPNRRSFPWNLRGDIDTIRAQITDNTCDSGVWIQDKYAMLGYVDTSKSSRVSMIGTGLIMDDYSGLLTKKMYTFNAKHPTYKASFANNIRLFDNGVYKEKWRVFSDSIGGDYKVMLPIKNFQEPVPTAIINYSEGCVDTLSLAYQRSIYSIDTTKLFVFSDSLFALSIPRYDGNLSLNFSIYQNPAFLNFNYYNLSGRMLNDATVTLNVTSLDTTKKSLVYYVNTPTINSFLLASPMPESVDGPYALPFYLKSSTVLPLQADSFYLLEFVYSMNSNPNIVKKHYTKFKMNTCLSGCIGSKDANLRVEASITNAKPSYREADTLKFSIKLKNTGNLSCALRKFGFKIYNSYTGALIPNNFSNLQTNVLVQPKDSATINTYRLPGNLFKHDNSNPNNQFDIVVYITDTAIGYRLDDTCKIRIHHYTPKAKLLITDVSFSKVDTAYLNDTIIRSITVYNAGDDTSFFIPQPGNLYFPGMGPVLFNGRDNLLNLGQDPNIPDKIVPKLQPGESVTFYDTISFCPELTNNLDKRSKYIKDPYYMIAKNYAPSTVDTLYVKQPMPFVDYTKPDISILPSFCYAGGSIGVENSGGVGLNYVALGNPFNVRVNVGNLSPIAIDSIGCKDVKFHIKIASYTNDTIFDTLLTVSNLLPYVVGSQTGTFNGGVAAILNFYFTLPTTLLLPYLGDYRLIVKIETNGVIESNYNNNISNTRIRISNATSPDLEVTKVIPYGTNSLSSIVRLDDFSIKNKGTATSSPTKLTIFFDTIREARHPSGTSFYSYQRSDTFGGSITVVSMPFTKLYKNTRYKRLAEFHIPAIQKDSTYVVDSLVFSTDSLGLTPGYWNYVAMIDDVDSLFERDEVNNSVIVNVRIVSNSLLSFHRFQKPFSPVNTKHYPWNCKEGGGSLLSGSAFPLNVVVENTGNSISDTAILAIRDAVMCPTGCYTYWENKVYGCITGGYYSFYPNDFHTYPVVKTIKIPPIEPGTFDTIRTDIPLKYTSSTNLLTDINIPIEIISSDTSIHKYLLPSNSYNAPGSIANVGENRNKRWFTSFGITIGLPQLEITNVAFDSLKTCGDSFAVAVTIANKSNAFNQTSPFRVQAKHNLGLNKTITVDSLNANSQLVLVFKSPIKFSGMDKGNDLKKTVAFMATLINLPTPTGGLDTAVYAVTKTIQFLRKPSATLPAVSFSTNSPPTIAWTASAGATFYEKKYDTPFGYSLGNGLTTATSFPAKTCSQYGNYTYSVQPFNKTCEYGPVTTGSYNCASPPALPPRIPPSGGSVDNDNGTQTGGTSGNGCVRLEAYIGEAGSAGCRTYNNCTKRKKVEITINATGKDSNNNTVTKQWKTYNYVNPGDWKSDFFMTGLTVTYVEVSCYSENY